MENKSQKNKGNLDVQSMLSLGYVYVLFLGIIHNALYYGYVDVNYLEYTSILDVLLSPVSIITSSLKALLAFLGAIIVALLYVKIILPRIIKRSRNKKKYESGKKLEQLNKWDKASKSNFILIFFGTLYLFGFFIGLGHGRGSRNKVRLANNDIKNNYRIEFNNGNEIEVRLIGKNSLNVFYLQKDKKHVLISPIDGNIRTMQKLEEENEK